MAKTSSSLRKKANLYVIDPDGKECKAEILRQEKRH